MIENIEIILSLAATAMGFVASTVTFAVKYVKNKTAKIDAEHHIGVRDVLLGFIAEAEKIDGYTGTEKKAYVLEKVAQFAKSNRVGYCVDRVSAKIDEIIALTKLVNTK